MNHVLPSKKVLSVAGVGLPLFMMAGLLGVLLGVMAPGCASRQHAVHPPLTEQQRTLNLESFEMAWATIRDKHWDPGLGGLDWDAVHDEVRPLVEKAATQSDYLSAMHGMIDRFGESHFSIVPADVFEAMENRNGEGSEDGTPGFDVRVIDGDVLVTKVDEGSQAAALGVGTGWQVLKADGAKLAPLLHDIARTFEGKTMLPFLQHQMAIQKLSGSIGDVKRVRFLDGGDKKVEIEIPLAGPKGEGTAFGDLPPIPAWLESERLEGNVGYIAFNVFMNPARLMPAFEKAIKSFMDCDGIIIDIRGNGGGMPIVAMGMAGWFLDEKNQYFGTMHMRDLELKFVVNPRLQAYRGPMAVLIDGSSASCAEIFPAGLRDMGRARLFGTRTAGAALPAQWATLPNGDFLFYPVADYFSKNGKRLEGVGVTPDVEAPHDRTALLAGKDNAVEAAIRWIHARKSERDT